MSLFSSVSIQCHTTNMHKATILHDRHQNMVPSFITFTKRWPHFLLNPLTTRGIGFQCILVQCMLVVKGLKPITLFNVREFKRINRVVQSSVTRKGKLLLPQTHRNQFYYFINSTPITTPNINQYMCH